MKKRRKVVDTRFLAMLNVMMDDVVEQGLTLINHEADCTSDYRGMQCNCKPAVTKHSAMPPDELKRLLDVFVRQYAYQRGRTTRRRVSYEMQQQAV